MKRILFYTLLLIPVISCDNKIKMNLIDKDIMIDILIDAHFLDAHFQNVNSKLKDSIIYKKFNDILVKNRVSLSQFEKTKAYYLSNENEYIKLNDAIDKLILERYSNYLPIF